MVLIVPELFGRGLIGVFQLPCSLKCHVLICYFSLQFVLSAANCCFASNGGWFFRINWILIFFFSSSCILFCFLSVLGKTLIWSSRPSVKQFYQLPQAGLSLTNLALMVRLKQLVLEFNTWNYQPSFGNQKSTGRVDFWLGFR